ncbi:PadR family transcriptional regulator [Philodulcilactobacillus myokoensis]|uniref:PadR family transcriptional regulator n=1 Tax=Philodulcilactobacillus myokoensis TaxID=2929573 RepID=A0A9W6B1D5_9LACO|nr:PadR family transcriptional regulator [Philodulcilactobacillus myokoensis]GLB46334.1 PadR family transcriptional regulator [Philodulcilactobacillus myokoensis]
MAIKMSSELLDGCVLGILEHQDYYGYALTQRVQESADVSKSTMYPVLRRLKKNQWLTTYDKPYHGRNRRYYRITQSGKDKLVGIKKEWNQFQAGINNMLGSGEQDE